MNSGRKCRGEEDFRERGIIRRAPRTPRKILERAQKREKGDRKHKGPRVRRKAEATEECHASTWKKQIGAGVKAAVGENVSAEGKHQPPP